MRRPFSYGRYTAEDSRDVLHDFGADLLDRLDWRPLFTEHDYTAAARRMWKEIFPDPRVEYFEDAGHYVLEDAADRLIPMIREFLQ